MRRPQHQGKESKQMLEIQPIWSGTKQHLWIGAVFQWIKGPDSDCVSAYTWHTGWLHSHQGVVFMRGQEWLLVVIVKGCWENLYQDRSIIILPSHTPPQSCDYDEPSIIVHRDFRLQQNLPFYQDVCSVIFPTYYNPALCLNSRFRILVSRPIKTHSGNAWGQS